jgi:calcium-dependent protein kinase
MKLYENKYSKSECEELVDKVFATVDVDRSGFLDFTEFIVAAMEKEKILSKEKLLQAFNMIDEN